MALRGLFSALSFLTVLPVPERTHRDRAGLAAAPGWYPAVGLLVGAAAAGAWLVLGVLAPLPRAVVVVAIPILLTRALHLDGFADVCDGLGVAGPRAPQGGAAPSVHAARLAAMRDPRLGTFGVAGLVLNLLWRVAAVAALPASAAFVLLASPALGRWAMVLALRWSPYGGGGRFGAVALRPSAAAVSGATTFLLLPGCADPVSFLAAAAAVLLLVRFWLPFARSRFGALTGDALGALNEAAELLVLAVYLLT